MKRFLFEVSFLGTNYHGWQIQKNAHSIQQEIMQAFYNLLKEDVKIIGCGRTDTGVHAEQFFFHVDLLRLNEMDKFIYQMNHVLPLDVSVKSIKEVADDFHARFSAISRTYEYRIIQKKDPFLHDLVTFINRDFDLEKMNQCSNILLNYNDFTSFSKVHTDVNNFNCSIKDAFWEIKDNKLVFRIQANRFLRNMVRAIVGTMLEVGRNKIDVQEFSKIIESKNRSKAGASALAKGLYLTSVQY